MPPGPASFWKCVLVSAVSMSISSNSVDVFSCSAPTNPSCLSFIYFFPPETTSETKAFHLQTHWKQLLWHAAGHRGHPWEADPSLHREVHPFHWNDRWESLVLYTRRRLQKLNGTQSGTLTAQAVVFSHSRITCYEVISEDLFCLCMCSICLL